MTLELESLDSCYCCLCLYCCENQDQLDRTHASQSDLESLRYIYARRRGEPEFQITCLILGLSRHMYKFQAQITKSWEKLVYNWLHRLGGILSGRFALDYREFLIIQQDGQGLCWARRLNHCLWLSQSVLELLKQHNRVHFWLSCLSDKWQLVWGLSRPAESDWAGPGHHVFHTMSGYETFKISFKLLILKFHKKLKHRVYKRNSVTSLWKWNHPKCCINSYMVLL